MHVHRPLTPANDPHDDWWDAADTRRNIQGFMHNFPLSEALSQAEASTRTCSFYETLGVQASPPASAVEGAADEGHEKVSAGLRALHQALEPFPGHGTVRGRSRGGHIYRAATP